jgi:hypothetical protein
VTQEQHYYPLGMAMSGVVNTKYNMLFMKKINAALAFFVVQPFLSSCDDKNLLYGSGTHVYSEKIHLECAGDSVIKKLTVLKATKAFGTSSSLTNGFISENKDFYSFVFVSNESKFALHVDVLAHTSNTTNILLNGIDDFNQENKWKAFNRDLTDAEKKEILTWFNSKVISSIKCNK